MVKVFINGRMIDLTLKHVKDELRKVNQSNPFLGEIIFSVIEHSGILFISLEHVREMISKFEVGN